MKKAPFLIICIILLLSGSLFARHAVGDKSIDGPVPVARRITPQLSYTLPRDFKKAIILTSPEKVIRFFESKGIDPQSLSAENLSPELKTELCSICKECCDEFGNVLLDVAAQHKSSQIEKYIVKVGDLYWSYKA